MVRKLKNKSNNLVDMAMDIAQGYTVQFSSDKKITWSDYDPEMHRTIFCAELLERHWRRKPDAFDVYWEIAGKEITCSHKQTAKEAWDAAMEHKAND